jgi:hypothetical protein
MACQNFCINYGRQYGNKHVRCLSKNAQGRRSSAQPRAGSRIPATHIESNREALAQLKASGVNRTLLN